MDSGYNYDLFVIGGGSGGLASSKAAARLGKKVGLADFVKPSPQGTTWGLGGTCVNVGCVPKKLMHFVAQIGDYRHEQVEAGWQGVDLQGKHDWGRMVATMKKYIQRLNGLHRQFLDNTGVVYHNKLATLLDAHTIELKDATGLIEIVTADKVLVSVGSRPTLPQDIPPANYITSDDLFYLDKGPGKTLVVGASYVALECAGFLHGLGYDVTVMVRSVLLRGFDQDMATRVGTFMEESGVKFIRGFVPKSVTAQEDGRKVVTWGDGQQEVFDTVMFAIGRTADTKNLGLESAGVKFNEKNGKILCNEQDETSAKNVYAIGDCVEGRLELTPVAIMCGRRLVKRLYDGGTQLMTYEDVATTVFTPLEYGCIGLAEEAAIQKFGEQDVMVFQTGFKPLAWNFYAQRNPKACYGKLIVQKSTDKVVGLHYLGPDAAEVTQGFGVAIKMGATKKDFDNTVGIHPSAAEEMVQMTTLKQK